MASVLDIIRGAASVAGQGYGGYALDEKNNVAQALAQAKDARESKRDAVLNALTKRQIAKPQLGDPNFAAASGEVAGAEAGARARAETPALVDRMKLTAPLEVEKAGQIARATAPVALQTHKDERLFDNANQPENYTTTTIGGDPSNPGSGEVVSVNTKTGERGHSIGMAKPTGMVTPTQRGQREEKLHDDYQQEQPVKHAAALANAVAQLRASAAQKTPQGDLNMIYGAVKLRDPNAVKEGELKLQTSARSLGTHVIAAWNKAASGQILTDQERTEIMDLVNEMVAQQDKLVAPVQARFGARARAVAADSAFVAPDPFAGARNRPAGFRP